MGQQSSRFGTLGTLASLIFAAFLLTATPALAGGPFHARDKARDISGLNDACGAAVDSKGDLYAASPGQSKVKIFNEAKTEIGSISNANEPCGLAVDSKGNLYVSERASGNVLRYHPTSYPFSGAPSYEAPSTVDASGKAKGISVDPYDDRLYVAEGDHVSVYDSKGALGTDEIQRILPFEATGGTYKLTFEGKPTNPIPFKASHAVVKEELEALSTIGAGNVSVGEGSPSFEGRDHIISFQGVLSSKDVPQIECDASGLEGSSPKCVSSTTTNGFNGHIGDGGLTKATGVAAYTREITGPTEVTRYLLIADAATDQALLYGGLSANTLKLRRTIKGPKSSQNFKFGEAGTAVAADSANGHFFLYDDGAEALDELEATGDFLDATTSPAFADAKPSAIAVDRSGGAADGTIYVGAGAGANARLLAFKALTKPNRLFLKGLSEALTVAKARAVATDRFGDVYIAAETKIYVYDNKGKKLLEFEDTAKPYALAVDSDGNLYVLDGATASTRQLTYYAPSSFPPSGSTTYTRHTPPLLEKKSALNALAVDPVTDHVFVGRGFLGFAIPESNRVQEWGSALEGSPYEGVFAPWLEVTNGIQTLGVYGATGSVYVGGANNQPITVLDATGSEPPLTKITGNGCPAGAMGSPQQIGIDPANGHLLEFKPGQAGNAAREYESSGACLAEFGTFAPEGTSFAIAADAACAIHRNGSGELEPLDETTTPTCQEFDPANGNVYVAFDGTNNTTQPFDVNAFGPLDYGTPPPPEEFKLTVKKTGTGSGTVTSSPPGIECGPDCSEAYGTGTKVTLTAKADPGSEFAGWSGACTGKGACEVTMSEAREVTAEFTTAAKAKFLLKVKLTGTGTGTGSVTSSPAGINCGFDCSEEYEEGKEVLLTGAPGANTKAVAWSGCDSVNGENKCVVSMGATKEVTATFDLEQHTLSVSKTGTGTGKVSSSPAGIDCGSTCSAPFDHGTKVTLSAKVDPGSEFAGWSGACTGKGACEVTMSEAKSVTATFDKEVVEPGFPLQVSLEGTGSGTVTADAGLISCEPFCEDEYPEGTKVTLTASPAAGALFMAWKGCDSGAVNGRQCTVTMSKARAVSATFAVAHELSVVKAPGSGPGKVQSYGGITCLYGCTSVSALIKEGTTVVVKQTPAKHFHFAGWGGDCLGTGACELTMGEDHEVSADFDEDPKFALSLSKTGGGQGLVKTKPAGTVCGFTCTDSVASFYEGQAVTITVKLNKGTTSIQWTTGAGTCTGKVEALESTCTVTMDAAKELVAKFE